MSDSVQSLARASSILEAIAKNNNHISITELSKVVDLHKSTVHRLLKSLIELGYVRQNANDSHYELTIKLFELGASVVRQNDLIATARPYLEKLSVLSGEVVHLVIPDQTDIIYVDKVESTHTLRMHSYIGKRSPMYCTAVGKAILATRSDDAVRNFWSQISPVKHTPYTIVDLESFLQELEQIRSKGIAYDNEEHETEIRCVGTALSNYSGSVVGAISISGPKQRMTDDVLNKLIPELLEVKLAISRAMGKI
jgi:DNA-binding IclR family transcriptional regulator